MTTLIGIYHSEGVELWRLGTPDRTAGEYRHGFAPVENETYHPMQYRQYWGAYNFTEDFPQGINFEIGASDVSSDWVSVHITCTSLPLRSHVCIWMAILMVFTMCRTIVSSLK